MGEARIGGGRCRPGRIDRVHIGTGARAAGRPGRPRRRSPRSPAGCRTTGCSAPGVAGAPTEAGEVQILPREFSLIDTGLPHVGPWNYAQRIPMFWYGPGVVPASPERHDPVTLADVAPTQADLLGFGGFDAPDGRRDAERRPARGQPPRLLVTLIWDAVGMDVLDAVARDLAVPASLRSGGAWFDGRDRRDPRPRRRHRATRRSARGRSRARTGSWRTGCGVGRRDDHALGGGIVDARRADAR